MNIKGFLLINFFLLAVLAPGAAQEQDSVVHLDAVEVGEPISPDSLSGHQKEKKGFFKRDYPNPKKALWMSYILPGAGQVYNKQYWKLPIVYGVYAGLIYAISFNTQQYNRLNDALLLKLEGEEHEFTGTRLDDAGTLRTLRDQNDKNRQLSYIGLVAAYALTGLEAFVSAHLKTFDVNEDLSLQLKPAMEPTILSPTPIPGLGLKLSFGGSSARSRIPLTSAR